MVYENIPCYHMVTVRIWSRLKTSWKSVIFTNKVGKNSRYSVGVFNKTILYSTCACSIWNDYSQLGATFLDGYLLYISYPKRTSLHHSHSLTTISRVCKAAPISLFWAPNRLNELPEVSFQFPFHLIGKLPMAFFNRPIMARTQTLVHRWESRTRIIFSAVWLTDLTRV